MKNKKLYFQKDDEYCYNLEYHLQYMKENNIQEMDVYLAKSEVRSDQFFCKHFLQSGERGECGKECQSYSPRNGVSGICKHFGYTYEKTDKKFTLSF